MSKLKIVLALTMVMTMIWLTSGSGCSTGSGGGSDTKVPCADSMFGAWKFMGSTSNGTLTFNLDGEVSGITQSGACSGFSLVGGKSTSDFSNYPMIITYTVKCGDGKTYKYTLKLNPVGDKCTTLSGTKTGNYSGGHNRKYRPYQKMILSLPSLPFGIRPPRRDAGRASRVAVGMRLVSLAIALCLGLGGLAGAAPPGHVELRLVALSAAQKAKLGREAGICSPPQLLRLEDLGQRVEIDRRTEFHAVLIDRTGRYEGRKVSFQWFHGSPPQAFVQPVTRMVRRFAGQPHPMAGYGCWSAPATGGKFWSTLFPSSVMKRSEWNKSRCYGPRAVRVVGEDGEILAERAFEIHKKGVRVY